MNLDATPAVVFVLAVVFVIADALDVQPGVVFVAFDLAVDGFGVFEAFALQASTTLRHSPCEAVLADILFGFATTLS